MTIDPSAACLKNPRWAFWSQVMPVYQLPPKRRSTKPKGSYINPPRAHIDRGFDSLYKSPRWKAFRAQIKAERGERCEDREHDDSKPREQPCELDHIKELSDGGQPFDRSNVLFRCRSCHVRKTNEEKNRRFEAEYWRRQID